MLASAAYNAIKSKLATDWAALHSTIPLLYPNEQRPTFDEEKTQVHVEIRMGAQRIAGYGSPNFNRYRQSGEVIVRILVPSQSGEAAARSYADDVAGILRGYQYQDLTVEACAPASGAASDENGLFYQLDVLAPFFYDLDG